MKIVKVAAADSSLIDVCPLSLDAQNVGISTPFQFGCHRENDLMSSQSSRVNDDVDGQDSPST